MFTRLWETHWSWYKAVCKLFLEYSFKELEVGWVGKGLTWPGCLSQKEEGGVRGKLFSFRDRRWRKGSTHPEKMASVPAVAPPVWQCLLSALSLSLFNAHVVYWVDGSGSDGLFMCLSVAMDVFILLCLRTTHNSFKSRVTCWFPLLQLLSLKGG